MLKRSPSLLISLLLVLMGGLLGWHINRIVQEPTKELVNASNPLRLKGYQFISPLLLCNTNLEMGSKNYDPLKQRLHNYLDETIATDKQTRVGVYFRSLSSGEEVVINPEERFNPASIIKLPLMIQLLKESEVDPAFLSQKGVFGMDNAATYADITGYVPKEKLVSGTEYTVEQLIAYMIKYSDNVSYNILVSMIGLDKAEQIYKDMALQFESPYNSTNEFITPFQVSQFFRLLYNATFLDNTNSEKALKMLSEVDFRDALVKKLPTNVTVSHKFGVMQKPQPIANGKEYGEFHDCGIIYKENNPYILCVMTESSTKDISTMEDVIAEISSIVYQY